MKKLTKLSITISIFVFSLLLVGSSLSFGNDTSCDFNSKSSLSPVKWIYYPDLSISVTDVNITRSDCGIMVTGTIKNKNPDVTLLAVALKFELYGNNSQSLGTLNVDPEGILFPEQQKASYVRVDPEGILKPNQTTHFVVKYHSPETASNLHHIYAQFISADCGVDILNNMGCFGQRVNVTKIDPETRLPIK
jgi:hypothetical protein